MIVKNKGKNLSQKVIVETYSPTHVGSGEDLKKGYDFILKDPQPFVVDIKKTLDCIESDDSNLNKYYKSADIEDLVSIAGKNYGYPLQNLSKNTDISSIREHLKDSFYRPFIPGSSLKGAIRTALYSEMIDKGFSQSEKEIFYNDSESKNNKLEEKIFGSDPQKDIMKSFSISDGYFEVSHLCLADIKIANVCNSKIKWRSLSYKKENKDDPKESKGLYIEALSKGSKAEFTLTWSEFLLSDLSWSESQIQNNDSLINNFEKLKWALNRHSLRIIENEMDFFKKYDLPETYNFYQNLKEEINNNENTAYIRLAWGSGWTGMTGLTQKLLKDNQPLRNFVKETNKKIKSQEVYPKSRKLVMEQKEPLGWVKIYPSDHSVKNPYEKKSSLHFSQNSKRDKFSPWLSKQILELKKKHNLKSTEDVLKGQPLSKEWDKLTAGDEKTKIREEIINYWKQKSWWDEPSGRSAKKVKDVYTD